MAGNSSPSVKIDSGLQLFSNPEVIGCHPSVVRRDANAFPPCAISRASEAQFSPGDLLPCVNEAFKLSFALSPSDGWWPCLASALMAPVVTLGSGAEETSSLHSQGTDLEACPSFQGD